MSAAAAAATPTPRAMSFVAMSAEAADADAPPTPLHALPEIKPYSLTEPEVGIRCYLNPAACGFKGIIKHRIADFVVNEISPQGDVLHLTNQDIPAIDRPVSQEAKFPKYAELSNEIKRVISNLAWSRVSQMAKKYLDEEKHPDFEKVSIDVTEATKDQRKSVHELLKTCFPHLTSNTAAKIDEDGISKKLISLDYRAKDQFKKSGRRNWPRDRAKYLHFHLYKEGEDTYQIFGRLEKKMYMNHHQFTSAGVKDKRGRTTQKVCHPFMPAEKLLDAVKSLFINVLGTRTVAVGNFSYEEAPIQLGDLSGNHFCCVIRDVSEPLHKIEPSLVSFKDNGFINYFGLQRFGTTESKSSDVGRELIKGNWDAAVELILRPRDNQKDVIRKATEHWWQFRDAAKAFEIIHRFDRGIEGNLLKGLAIHSGNTQEALKSIKSSMRTFYAHAYQSLVWNEVVSRRVEKFGTAVLEGDLVMAEASDDSKQPRTNDSEQNVVAAISRTTEPSDSSSAGDEADAARQSSTAAKVTAVTAENAAEFAIYDVVMPLPGADVAYPEHADVRGWYEQALAADGLSLVDSFKPEAAGSYALYGGYRKLVARPTQTSWRETTYTEPDETLTVSDAERLRGVPEIDAKPDGRFRALILEFSLAQSCYATMALREAMKADTGFAAQRHLSLRHQEQSSSASAANPPPPVAAKRPLEAAGAAASEEPARKAAKTDRAAAAAAENGAAQEVIMRA